MKQYLDMLRHVMTHGTSSDDRTGTGTYSVFGYQTRYNLDEGFPLATTCKTPLRWITEELLWMRDGKTNNEDLMAKGVDIWKEWAIAEDTTVRQIGTKEVGVLIEELAAAQKWPLTRARNEFLLKSHQGSVNEFSTVVLSKWLREMGVEPDIVKTTPKGALGPIYGAQWRNFAGVDQLKALVAGLRSKPFSRRHIVTAWNPAVLPDESISPQENVLHGKAALASCHAFFQCHCRKLSLKRRCEISGRYMKNEVDYYAWFTEEDDERHDGDQDRLEQLLATGGVPSIGLTLQMYQRSCDICCGARFNIAFYALLNILLANELGYHPEEFIHDIGDLHIYKNHLKPAMEQLKRQPERLPKLQLKCPVGTSIFDIKYEDLVLTGYNPQPKLDFPISI